MLRRFGVYLIDDAAWVGGLLVVIALLLAERRLPAVGGVASNLVALGAVSLVVMLLCRLLDLGPWSDGTWNRLHDAARFSAAWAPMAICLPGSQSRGSPGATVSFLVVLASLVIGSLLATALRSEDALYGWGAALLAIAAAITWSAELGRHKRLS